MTTYSWATTASGDWNTGTLWTDGVVPNNATADVTIDVGSLVAYTITIGAGESFTIDSLTINDTDATKIGANSETYAAAALTLDGTLTFAPGSAGILGNSAGGGSLQTYIFTDPGDSAEIVNAGTIDGFIQIEGNLLLTGTNGVYITNELQALGGTVTIDTASIAELAGNTLFDGIFEAVGPSAAAVDLGGVREGLVVNIGTIEGPAEGPNQTAGWTELTFNGPDTTVNEWDGTAYVPVESTLTEIDGGGTVDVLTGRDYTTTNTLTIGSGGAVTGPGMFNLQAGVVSTGGIDINGGVVQGYGTIASGVVNDGTLIALGGTVSGTLAVTGALTGTGEVLFDSNDKTGATDLTKATLVVGSVSAGQTVTMNGGDTLVLATPSAFAGTISAGIGDSIVLDGVTATSAVLTNGTLVVKNGTAPVAALALSGNYTGDSFTTNGSIVTVATAVAPAISGTAGGQAITDQQTIAPFSKVVIADATVGQTETVTVTLSDAANGTLSNLGGGAYNATTGVYTDTGSAATVTADLNALVFTPTPTPNQITTGQTLTTTFAIQDTDTVGGTATDTTTSVISSVPPDSHNQFVVVDKNGSSLVLNTFSGQDQTQTMASGNIITFTDGIGVFDPTGAAEDIARLYGAALGRAPDVGGLEFWTAQVDDSLVPLSAVANSITTSPEFIKNYGSLSNDAFVNHLYQDVLGRSADAGGAQYWDSALASGVSRGTVVLGFAESQEYEADTISTAGDVNNAELYRLYQAALDRAPDAGGQSYWSSALANGATPTQVAQDFINSPEFQKDYGALTASEFVSTLYQNALHRAADPGGLQFWTSQLQQGSSEASVLVGIADSQESRTLTASATHANWVFIPA
jgi:hypothetical protein